MENREVIQYVVVEESSFSELALGGITVQTNNFSSEDETSEMSPAQTIQDSTDENCGSDVSEQ